MKLYIKKSLILATINFVFLNYVWSTPSCYIDEALLPQSKLYTHTQTHANLALFNKNIKELFTKNKLPKNSHEIYEAKCLCIAAISMLKKGMWAEALLHLFKAEEYWIPDSIFILRNIVNNQYPHVPIEISQAIRDQFQVVKEAMLKNQFLEQENIDPINSLYKTYDQKFMANEKKLATGQYKTSKVKILWYNIADILFMKNEHSHNLDTYPVLETQIPLLNPDQIDTSKKIN